MSRTKDNFDEFWALYHPIEQAGLLRCYYCGHKIHRGKRKTPTQKMRLLATVDHKHPRSRGGSNDMTNLVPCCEICNSVKANMSDDDFIELLLQSDWVFPGSTDTRLNIL